MHQSGLRCRFFNIVRFVCVFWFFNDHSRWSARPVIIGVLSLVFLLVQDMSKRSSDTILRSGQRLFGIVIAILVAIVAGFAAVFFLDAILPLGKSGQMPTIFLGAFVAAGAAGVACMRAIGPKASVYTSIEHQTPTRS